jgi:putative ABC transport system ATP-binding protein
MTEFAIKLDDVRFRWKPDDPPVLDIPHLAITVGERLLIQGPSGSGKTTLLSLLGGVALPQAGTVELFGTTLTQLGNAQRDAFRADCIGFVFQMFNLVPYLSLIDNVTLPCRFSAARRRVALESSPDLEQEADRLLTQLELDVGALAGRPVTELSAGQQQRVAVARALIGAPPLIIADEPTSALDADARHAFLDLLFREVEAAKATLIFVSHDRDLGARFDRAVALADINRAA